MIDKKTLAAAKSYADKVGGSSSGTGEKLSLVVNGEGNVVSDISLSNSILTVTKGEVTTDNDEIWMGTVAELEALTEEEKAKYTIFITTDEEGKVVTDLKIIDDEEGEFITGLTLNEQNEFVITRGDAQHPDVTVLADSEKTADLAHGDTQTVVTGILTDEDGHLCQSEKTTFTLPTETELSLEEVGTGNVITNVAVENHKITVTKENRVEQDVTITPVGEGEFITGITATNHDITVTKGNVTLDGKVKMDADSSSQYLTQLLDGVTIENEGGYLVVKGLQGMTVGANELNCLLGVDFNIAERFNDLTNPLTFLGVVDTFADLAGLTPENGNVVIVRQDSNNENKQMTYIYSTEWNEVSENEIELRNFTLNPLDLEKETTGILPISKVDVSTLATKADIEGMLTSETPVTVTESGTGSFVTGLIPEGHKLTVVKGNTHFVYGVSDLVNAPTNTMFQWQGESTETFEKGQFYVKDESDNVTKITDFATKGEIPTKTTDLENDSNFITLDDVPAIPSKTSDLTNDSNYITSADLPTVPTKVSELENDSNFITNSDLPTVPTKTSEIENDSGFITSETQLSVKEVGDGNVVGSVSVSGHEITINKATVSSGSGVTIEQNQGADSNYNFGSKVELVTGVTQSENGNVTVTKTPMHLMDLDISVLGEGEFVKSIQITNDTDDNTGAGIRVLEVTKGGADVDLTNYATKGELPTKTSDLTNDSNYITSADLPTVPTKVSELENDSQFITTANLPTKVSEIENDAGFITSADLPTVPTKTSDLTNNSGFITSNDLPSVPTKVSQLTNDSNFITNSDLPTNVSELANDAGYITSDDLPSVPTKTSQLTNDSNFITLNDVVESGKVKLTEDGSQNYLSNLIDSSTLEIKNNVLTVKAVDGITNVELGYLKGVTSNIQDQINTLSSSMSFLGVVDTYADLLTLSTAMNGSTAIVRQDETNNSLQMTYIYTGEGTYDSSNWVAIAETTITVRDFSTNPINLTSEVTGVLPISNVDVSTLATKTELNAKSITVSTTQSGDIVSEITASGSHLSLKKIYLLSKIGLMGSEAPYVCSVGSEGYNVVGGNQSHATGKTTFAFGEHAYAEGDYSTSFGNVNKSVGNYSTTFGKNNTAYGENSFVEGLGNTAYGKSQLVFGQYCDTSKCSTEPTYNKYLEIVGNGTDDNNRSNARTLDWNGNQWLTGTCTATGFYKTDGTEIINQTKLSELENDTNFITQDSLPTKVSELENDSNFVTASSLPTKVTGLTLTFTDGTTTYENENIHADSLISIFWDDPTCGIEVSNVEEGKITFTCDETPSNTKFSIVIM